jgi:hypothetical protein
VAVSAAACARIGFAPTDIYCFEIGYTATVVPAATAGRIAFVTAGQRTAAGLGALDTLCIGAWTGAPDPISVGTTTCTDWASITTGSANFGRPGEVVVQQAWNNGTTGCSDTTRARAVPTTVSSRRS